MNENATTLLVGILKFFLCNLLNAGGFDAEIIKINVINVNSENVGVIHRRLVMVRVVLTIS